jgi:hypothetical protein
LLENLEGRLLLYSTLGAQFVYGSRITYSFVPDGADIGGYSNVLFQTLNSRFPTAAWQLQFQKAAAVWQAVANINLVQVSDDGSPLGADGDQQGDPRFGDIRFSAIPQSSATMAVCFLPPPINGGSDAGDIVLNSTVSWQINSPYDLETVAIHEIGHALGMGHSQISTACMYASYNGTKQSLSSDDISGIQSIWQAPQPDQFNSNGQSNATYSRAANITSYIDANGQIAIPNLRLQSGSQVEWFSVTVPRTTTGTLVATVQGTDLSLLSPRVSVFTTGLSLLGDVSSSCYGGTATVFIGGVQPGQTYLIRAVGNASVNPTGGFGLELNFGSVYQPPIPPPNTVVLQQPDRGGGGITAPMIAVGRHAGYGEALTPAFLSSGPPVGWPPSNSPAGSGAAGYAGPLMTTVDVTPAPGTPADVLVVSGTAAPILPDVQAQAAGLDVLQALDNVLSSWRPRNIGTLFQAPGSADDVFLS